MEEAKISIIVPVYNTGKYIARCLSTLMNQSEKNCEIIIVNDGSTDDSHEIIADTIRENNNFKYINLKKNMGLGNARNIGLAEASSKLVAFIDSDDWIDLDAYKKAVDIMTADNNIDILVYGIKNEFNNSILSSDRYFYEYSNLLNNEQALKLLTHSYANNYYISPVVWNKIYKRSLIQNNNISFLKNSFWEDDIFSFMVILYAKNIMIYPNLFCHYYQRESSITKTISKKHIDDLIESFIWLKDKLVELNLFKKYELEYKSNLDKCIHSISSTIAEQEKNLIEQKNFYKYLLNRFFKSFSVSKTIDYLDLERIKRLFNV